MSTSYPRVRYLILPVSIMLLVLAAGLSVACSGSQPTPASTLAPSPTPEITPTAAAMPTEVPDPTMIHTPTPEPPATPSHTAPTETPVPAQTARPPATPVPTPVVLHAGAGPQETKQFDWQVSGDLVALVDIPGDWEVDAELMAAYAGRQDVDALFLRSAVGDGLPSLSIYRLARMDDSEIAARLSKFLEPSDERKGQQAQEGEIGAVGAVIMTSVSVSEQYGNERVARVFVHLEDHHTWMIACYALEFDAGQHADCDSALASVRIAPESRARTSTESGPAANAELAAKYTEAGEGLGEARSPDITWSDGSNWRDGVSDRLPDLPLALNVDIQEGMTCTQWEALEMAVFPEGEGYDLSNWTWRSDSDEIATRWKENLARVIWGDGNGAMARKFIGPVFEDHCGSRMQ